MEQAVLFLQQIPADGGTRHSPGASSGRGRGLEPGRSVREPDIPVLERNGTGTGGSPPLIATLLQITGNGLKQAVAVPGLVRFSTEIPRQVQEFSRDRRWFPAARPGCQARCQGRMDDEPSGE